MVAGIAAKQQALEDCLTNTEHSAWASLHPLPSGSCHTRVVYKAIFLLNVHLDNEVVSLGRTSLATTVENQGTLRESVDECVLSTSKGWMEGWWRSHPS